eukprot:364400-Chlamydomonas_euryale.AAC.3
MAVEHEPSIRRAYVDARAVGGQRATRWAAHGNWEEVEAREPGGSVRARRLCLHERAVDAFGKGALRRRSLTTVLLRGANPSTELGLIIVARPRAPASAASRAWRLPRPAGNQPRYQDQKQRQQQQQQRQRTHPAGAPAWCATVAPQTRTAPSTLSTPLPRATSWMYSTLQMRGTSCTQAEVASGVAHWCGHPYVWTHVHVGA